MNHRGKRAKIPLYLLYHLLYREAQFVSMQAQLVSILREDLARIQRPGAANTTSHLPGCSYCTSTTSCKELTHKCTCLFTVKFIHQLTTSHLRLIWISKDMVDGFQCVKVYRFVSYYQREHISIYDYSRGERTDPADKKTRTIWVLPSTSDYRCRIKLAIRTLGLLKRTLYAASL